MFITKSKSFNSEVVDVSPELAAYLLTLNKKNRTISKDRVDKLSSEIINGNWRIAQPIIFDSNGALADGQHRLAAIIKAAKTVSLPIQTGVDEAAVICIDTGRPRGACDVLKMRDETQSVLIASIIKVIHGYNQRGYIKDGNTMMTNKEVVDMLDQDSKFRDAARYGNAARHQFSCIPPTIVGSTWYILMDINHLKAELFMDGLIHGAGLTSKDPVLILRNKLINLYSDKLIKIKNTTMYKYIFSAWRHHVKGNKIVKLPLHKNAIAKP